MLQAERLHVASLWQGNSIAQVAGMSPLHRSFVNQLATVQSTYHCIELFYRLVLFFFDCIRRMEASDSRVRERR